MLNLHKLYLIVDRDNAKAIHVYQGLGFAPEGELKEEFFIDGKYRTAFACVCFQRDFQADDANRD